MDTEKIASPNEFFRILNTPRVFVTDAPHRSSKSIKSQEIGLQNVSLLTGPKICASPLSKMKLTQELVLRLAGVSQSRSKTVRLNRRTDSQSIASQVPVHAGGPADADKTRTAIKMIPSL